RLHRRQLAPLASRLREAPVPIRTGASRGVHEVNPTSVRHLLAFCPSFQVPPRYLNTQGSRRARVRDSETSSGRVGQDVSPEMWRRRARARSPFLAAWQALGPPRPTRRKPLPPPTPITYGTMRSTLLSLVVVALAAAGAA